MHLRILVRKGLWSVDRSLLNRRQATLRPHGLPSDLGPLRGETDASIRWSTPEMLIERVEALRKDIERQY
jgi:hypothetical protein